MKAQYFGDINDYRKYGILRCLAEAGLAVGVHWMLTPDDSGRDGRKLDYLKAQVPWREFDPPLFDLLGSAVSDGMRGVHAFERSRLLPGGRFFSEHVPDRGVGRETHFERAREALAGAAIVFFDPDNGIEVPSTSVRARGSCKFIYWAELLATWGEGQSLLVYQHYPRVTRHIFEARLQEAGRAHTGASPWVLRTGHVLFLLFVQPHHSDFVGRGVRNLMARWGDQVEISGGV